MRLPFPRRSRDEDEAYLAAARAVLGPPATRRVTPLAVLLAHDIACGQGTATGRDAADRQALLGRLAGRYGVDEGDVLAERDAVAGALVPGPALR